MKIKDITDGLLEARRTSRKVCKSSKTDDELGVSQLASCKSQGLRRRSGRKRRKVKGKWTTVGGKYIKGAKDGNPNMPHYGSGTVQQSKSYKRKKRRKDTKRRKKK